VGILWGIDLGGTKIEGVVFEDSGHERPIARLRVPTESDLGYEQVVSNCARLVGLLESESGVRRPPVIGIGTPGSRDPNTGLMRNCNTVCLIGRDLQQDLAHALGTEVLVTNDANSFALAEAELGAARGARCVFGVIVGTGVGGGIVLGGEIWNGANGIAGEWGHNLLEPDGEPCYCGRRGCVETVLSGPALERHYARLTGSQARLPEILAGHRSGGNTAASQVVNRLCEGFGRALAGVVNVLDPDVIVLGGGVGQIQELYDKGTEALRRNVFHEEPRLDVRSPQLGDSAGVFGAALQVRTRR
jgi:fructokinase